MMIRHSVILATASALSALACVSASHLDTTRAALCGDRPGLPVLTLVDSVVLAESDAEYLANPAAGFLVDTGGQLLIPDAGANRVRVYQADGSLERVIGRSGSGPGNFEEPGASVCWIRICSYGTITRPERFWSSIGGPEII